MKNYFKIVDDPKVKTSELLAKCEEKFPTWCFLSDKNLDKEVPPPKEPTTRYFKKEIESSDLENISLAELDKKDIEYATLRERILMELVYFEETGGHLDIDNVTVTSSHYSDGSALYAYWHDEQFKVSWWYRDDAYPYGRIREAVSLNLADLKLYEATLTNWKDLANKSVLDDLAERIEKLERFEEQVRKFLIL